VNPNLGVVAAVSAPLAGLIMVLIALYRVKTQQRREQADARRIEADLNKHVANRRIMLEQYADDVARYHRILREFLLKLADEGIIDINRVDLSTFPRPPKLPIINGDNP
jgi:hypothetical protein